MIHAVTGASLAWRLLPFFSRVWHTAQLYKLRDTQRSPADRTKTYCALRRSSEEWATYWCHPPWFAHSGKLPLIFKDNSHASKVIWIGYDFFSGFANENCCRQKHIMSLLLFGNRVQMVGHCCWCIDCATRLWEKSMCVCLWKTFSHHSMLWFTMNYNKS